MRVALYARVSTEEQARHGLSIDAQLDSLRAWVQENGHTVAGEYVDAGISGKKAYKKRPALSQFMDDIEAGAGVDALVFCKLDRFYRSVKLYYQAMEILDRHKVAWIAIQEDYETVTASGRFKVNIMLSVAENEADRTSERIKSVFEYKTEKGECLNPNGLPLGYTCRDKKVVPDGNADAARAVFEHYAKHGNVMQAMDMLREDYGVKLPPLSISNMLRNPLYTGEYRGNKTYCEPIISPVLFDQVQDDLARRATRRTPTGRIYLFSGLLFCKECGHRMAGGYRPRKKIGEVPYYRCPQHYTLHRCRNKSNLTEEHIERFLLDHLQVELDGMEREYNQRRKQGQKKKPIVNRAAIMKKLDRLKDLYLDELITKEQYKTDYEKLTAQLDNPSAPAPRFREIKELIGDHFQEDYAKLAPEQRKEFWRAVVDHVEVDGAGGMAFYFRR